MRRKCKLYVLRFRLSFSCQILISYFLHKLIIGYSERKTELKLIKFHFETLPSVHSCYRSFVRGYIGRCFPTHTGLFLTGKAGARIQSEIVQTDVGALHDSCSLCVLVNVKEQ